MDYFGIVVIVWMHSGNEKNEVGIRFNEPIKKGTNKNKNLNSSQHMTSKRYGWYYKTIFSKSNVFLKE